MKAVRPWTMTSYFRIFALVVAVQYVVDRGIGIEKADRDRIFEKFYRGRGASIHREGFGLGLPIIQELIHAHGGRVEVESVVGQGSTFRVILPIAPLEPAAFDESARHATEQKLMS